MFNAYYNGEFSNTEDLRISLKDRSVYFGDGIYDAVLGYNGKLFLLEKHIERFFKNASLLNIPIFYSRSEIYKIINCLTEKTSECIFLYIQLSRVSDNRCHSYGKDQSSRLLVTVTQKPLPNAEKTLNLVSYPDERYYMCHIKTLNLLPSVLASTYAEQKGADEAVFHRGKIVTECAHSNCHIIKDGILYSHPDSNLILSGIERAHLFEVAKDLSVPIKLTPFTLEDMKLADEVIITSTTRIANKAIRFNERIYNIASHSIGSKIIKKMHEDFFRECI